MARFVALVLCALAALAASAAARSPSHHGAPRFQVDEMSVSHAHVVEAVDQMAQELEAELVTLMSEAERHHSLLTATKGINIDKCVQTAFNDALIVTARLLDLIDSVRCIADDLLIELGKCKGNIITSLPCRLNVLKDALDKARALNGKGRELLDKLKKAVQDLKSDCLPSGPTTAPTSAAPTSAAPTSAAPTSVAPTSETPEPTTVAPEPTTEAPEPSTGATDAPEA